MTQKLVYDGLQSCPYLEGRVARMPLYRQLGKLTLEESDRRFAAAERRVGTCLYRTACPTCRACEGIRVPVAEFAPSPPSAGC
jgi:leucyl-tRNA---protein transferase